MSPTDVGRVTSYPEYGLLQIQKLGCVALFFLSSWAGGFQHIYAAAAAAALCVFKMEFPSLFLLSVSKRASLKRHFTTDWVVSMQMALPALLGATDK